MSAKEDEYISFLSCLLIHILKAIAVTKFLR